MYVTIQQHFLCLHYTQHDLNTYIFMNMYYKTWYKHDMKQTMLVRNEFETFSGGKMFLHQQYRLCYRTQQQSNRIVLYNKHS